MEGNLGGVGVSRVWRMTGRGEARVCLRTKQKYNLTKNTHEKIWKVKFKLLECWLRKPEFKNYSLDYTVID